MDNTVLRLKDREIYDYAIQDQENMKPFSVIKKYCIYIIIWNVSILGSVNRNTHKTKLCVDKLMKI